MVLYQIDGVRPNRDVRGWSIEGASDECDEGQGCTAAG
jgi:hypothetical protein